MNATTVDTPQGRSGTPTDLGSGQFSFRYAPSAQERAAVCLSMPVRYTDYPHVGLHPIFQMNLPEGFVLEALRNRFAKTSPLNPMLLLAMTGRNEPIGRLRIDMPGLPPVPELPGERLADLIAWDGTEDLFDELRDKYLLRSGISGVQPKLLVPESPADRQTSITRELIIKSGGHEWPHLAINEFLCMSIARASGLNTPEFHLSNNHRLFIMRRFDRNGQTHLGFEDMAVLMGMGAHQKYAGSYEHIARAIRLFCAPDQIQSALQQLFLSVAVSCLVGNGDAHLKNFGLLYSDPTAHDTRLAPAYDIVNTTAYLPNDSLALQLAGQKSFFSARVGLRDFAVQLDIDQPVEHIRHILEAIESVLSAYPDLAETAPKIVHAIRASAQVLESAF
ncbi:type II toxin-antitoxin system HipA family toxin [Castellaniella ginsengisoli]|uniref:Type II toxin-antitoxin system HipA family toxin n=1 Tax=Castellaniella ginsengisoli TaxID=546114 RepID=A0AB39E929_9BURK